MAVWCQFQGPKSSKPFQYVRFVVYSLFGSLLSVPKREIIEVVKKTIDFCCMSFYMAAKCEPRGSKSSKPFQNDCLYELLLGSFISVRTLENIESIEKSLSVQALTWQYHVSPEARNQQNRWRVHTLRFQKLKWVQFLLLLWNFYLNWNNINIP